MIHMIACPECSQTLQVPDELIGKAVQCPQCRHAFSAAAPVAAAPAPADPVTSKPPQETKKEEKRRVRELDDDESEPLQIKKMKPGHVTALGIMALAGGITAVTLAIAAGAGTVGMCCLWPGTYYSLVVGVMGIIRGAALLGNHAYEEPPPRTLAIMMIVNIINGDVICLTLGIVMLTFCNEREVIEYLKQPAHVG